MLQHRKVHCYHPGSEHELWGPSIQELLEMGTCYFFVQNSGLEMCQMQWPSQVWESQRVRMVFQTKWQDQPSKARNEERQTLPSYIQMLKLPWRSSSRLQCLPILVPLIQQRVADEEVFRDLWKQIKVHLFRREHCNSTMILKSLKILLQNVHKNALIIHSLLKTQNCYDIILIQELPWSEIQKVPSLSNSKGDPFIGTNHHPNWIMFDRVPMDSNDLPRVISYVM